MNLTRHLAATYAHLEPRDIEAARAIVRRKRQALVIAAALVLVMNVGCACATSSQDATCEVSAQ